MNKNWESSNAICAIHKTKSVSKKTQTGCITVCLECLFDSRQKMIEAIDLVIGYHGEHMEDWLYNKVKESINDSK